MEKQPFMWGFLAHFGTNMWNDFHDTLQFDWDCWNEDVELLKEAGCNTIVIDIGEFIRYDSHPEIAVKGSYPKQVLADEIARLRSLGFEVLPKLNFSTCHDQWLGVYARMISTPIYYQVCKDLIDEVCELFGNPRLFHLGLDEELIWTEDRLPIIIVRNSELFWHDFGYLCDCVKAHGARPWIWADYIWHTEERRADFLAHMPKDVLCSNGYYHDFSETDGIWKRAYESYALLEENGFDQIPTAYNQSCKQNLDLTVAHTQKVISPEHLQGYLMTSWVIITPEFHDRQLESIRLLKEAHEKFLAGGYEK